MNVDEIKQLIQIVEKSDIAELEVTKWGKKVKISKNATLTPELKSQAAASHIVHQEPAVAAAALPAPAQPAPAAEKPVAPAPQQNLVDIKSPMVGTFYRAPSPEADAYVKVGDSISTGHVLCILEAMKLMNEIEAEFPCRIVEILIENGQPVEYNQPIFRAEKT